MGSYAIIVKTEEIRKKVHEGELLSAQEILDTLDLKKVKNLSDLNLMAGVYKENGYYEEAAEIYYRIYQKSHTRKTIAQLIDISIKRDDITEAERYFTLYEKYAQEDYESHIFRFKIDKLQGASYEQLIQSLENLKKLEYSEKWAYELAKLYYKAGMEEECVKECSDIILWFCEGTYVEKAKLLRSYYANGTNKEKIMEELKRRAEAIQERSQEAAGKIIDFQSHVQPEYETTIQDEAVIQNDAKQMMDYLYDEVAIALDEELVREEGNSIKGDPELEEIHYNNKWREIQAEQQEEFIAVQQEEIQAEQQEEMLAEQQEDMLAEQQEDMLAEQQEEIQAEQQEEIQAEQQEEIQAEQQEEIQAEQQEEILAEQQEELLAEQQEEMLAEQQEEILAEQQEELQAKQQEEIQAKQQEELQAKQQEEIQTEQQQKPQVEDEVYVFDLEADTEEDFVLAYIASETSVKLEEVFGDFLKLERVKLQLMEVLVNLLQVKQKPVGILITGDNTMDNINLAKNLALFMNKAGKLTSPKVAKITAQKLNMIDIITREETLKSCCLMIENASELLERKVVDVIQLEKLLHGDFAVIFMDDKMDSTEFESKYTPLQDIHISSIRL